MFFFVLLMIGLTNLALGYSVASHFGFGLKTAMQSDVALAQSLGKQPSFAILGGSTDETPHSELPPAKPIETAVETIAEPTAETPAEAEQPAPPEDSAPTVPDDEADLVDGEIPSEVNDFTALGGVIAAEGTDDHSGDHAHTDDESGLA
jgi:hypothetical protein